MAEHRVAAKSSLGLVGVLLALASTAAPLVAQRAPGTGLLTGFVIDVSSGRPVRDAIVAVPDLGMQTVTDQEGAFRLHDVPAGAHALSVRKFGYLDRNRTITMGTSRRHVQLGLEPAPFGLEGLTVSVTGSGPIAGRIVEAGTGATLGGVVVWVPAERRGEAADTTGRFVVPEIPYGLQVLQVMRAGYGARLVTLQHGPERDPIEIALEPNHGILSRLPAISDRLRGRRNAFQAIVTTHDTERLTRSGAEDVREYLFKFTLTKVVPCSGIAKSFWCVEAKGQPIEPRVCIDGWLEWGGLDLLQRMGPNELHLLEIYGATGATIRAYTHDYIERLAQAGDGVATEEPTPQRAGVEGLGWASNRSGMDAPMGMRC